MGLGLGSALSPAPCQQIKPVILKAGAPGCPPRAAAQPGSPLDTAGAEENCEG